MGFLINCAACGKPHPVDASSCKARKREIPKVMPYQQVEVDRIEQLAIERHNYTRRKGA